VSNASSTSQLQCVCAPGFTCNYNRVVTAVITLAMTEAQFTGAVRAAFLEAVALAARTTPDKVTIKRIVAAGGGGGASRRLLAARVYVLMEIEGGEGRSLRSLWRRALTWKGLDGVAHGLRYVEQHQVTAWRDA